MKGEHMNIFDNFSIDRLLFSLKYMWQGMLCIFAVISVIILAVLLMNYFSNKTEERKKLRGGENKEENKK